MADAIQKLKNSMNRGITAISVKTSSSLEKSKLNTHIDTLEKEIQNLFLTIGANAYDLWESGATGFQNLEEKLASVKQKKEEIARLTAERDSIAERDHQILGTASPQVPTPPMPPASTPAASAAIFCPQCGAGYETAIKFCRKCGCNLQSQ